MILSGILLTPTGLPFSNSLVRITANITSPDVLQFVQRDFKTDVDGAYSIDVPNGWYSVSVFSIDFRAYTSIGNIEITDATTQTTINELLMIGQTAHSDPLVAQVAAYVADVTTKTARFLRNSATNPTLRDDGSALQIGDQYFNTVTQDWNTYTALGWINNNPISQVVWTQSSPLATWTIPHNLNRYPTVTVVDNLNSKLEVDVTYVDSNIVQIIFGNPFSGKAYIN
jgi:hypothetical protein